MKATQYFDDDYLARCQAMTPDEIIRFVEDFRELHAGQKARAKLISLKVPENLLAAFKRKAKLTGIPYQTQIKQLMQGWLLE